jgi:TRAP-type mannitol/chloroaromatic compound transport system permease small subunit
VYVLKTCMLLVSLQGLAHLLRNLLILRGEASPEQHDG